MRFVPPTHHVQRLPVRGKRLTTTMTSSPGKNAYLPLSACASVDQFFSQFVYNPTSSSPLSHPHTPTPKTTSTKNERRKGARIRKGNRNENKNGKNMHRKKHNMVDRGVESNGRKTRKREKCAFLTSKQRFSEPYMRVPKDRQWVPPSSPHGLLQEHYYHDPWKVLVICILCNRTRGSQIAKIIHEFFSLCPSAEATIDVPDDMIESKIRNLGLHRKRALAIKRLSKEYLEDWTFVTQLHAVGKYAADAYAIFCSGYWRAVTPVDHKLVEYWKFLHDVDKTSTTLGV